jgi:hypothetical protein
MSRAFIVIFTFSGEERRLKLWQDQQLAKSIEDNTINRVLESYIMFFQNDHRHMEQVAEEQVEDQAVLAAIGVHGLQEQQNQAVAENDLSAELSEIHEQLFNNPSPEPVEHVLQPPEDLLPSHNEFMEQAVLSAIQIKGIGLSR